MSNAKAAIFHIYNTTSVDRKSIHRLFVLVGILMAAYLFFLSTTVFHIISQRSAESTVARANSEIGNLEGTYFNKSSAIDLSYAKDLGFTESTHTIFAARENRVAFGTSLSGNDL